MKRIKILRIIARLNIGGPAIHTILLTDGLDRNRFDSLLACGAVGTGEAEMSYYAQQKGVTAVYIPELKRELNTLNDLIVFIKILRLIKTEKPDIIHTHTAKAGVLGRSAGIVYNIGGSGGIKLIHTFHGHIFEGYFNKFLTAIFILIEKFLAYFTYPIITVSESVKNELIGLGICKADKIKVIPLGFELEKFLNINTDKYESNANVRACPESGGELNTLNVGIVGRLVPIKNHHLFLEAAAIVIKKNPQLKVRFKIVGDGELRGELEEYSRKLNIAGCVEFTGWQKDLPRVYADLDIVCLTSLNEGTPVSLIEAMAARRTVVATQVGGVVDLLGEEMKVRENFIVRKRGVTVRPNDTQGFAKALTFVLENEDIRKTLTIAAREYVKDSFSKERLLRDMEKLYSRV